MKSVKTVIQSLYEIRIMKNIGIVINSSSPVGLGCEIVAFLKGIYQYIDKGIYHEYPEKNYGRQ